jgi:hypothetical protein
VRQEGKGHGLRDQLSSHRKQDSADHDGGNTRRVRIPRRCDRNEEQAEALGLTGTPGLLVGPFKVPGFSIMTN